MKVAIKVASKILKRKEGNCAFENLDLRCGAIKKSLRTCALQRSMPNSDKLHVHMCVVSGPDSQDTVFKREYASPSLQCSAI
jgi:hypothetical protein